MKRDKLLFRLSCIAFAISPLSLLLKFAADYKGDAVAVTFAVLTGVLFYSGLILGIVFLVLVNISRKRSKANANGRFKEGGIGLLRFFSNRTAMIFDTAMIILFILTVLSAINEDIRERFTIVLASFLLMTVYMHSMFNGMNYKYIKSL